MYTTPFDPIDHVRGTSAAVPLEAVSKDGNNVRRIFGITLFFAFLASLMTVNQAPGLGYTLAAFMGVGAWFLTARLLDRKVSVTEKIALAAFSLLAVFLTIRADPWLVTYNLVGMALIALFLPLSRSLGGKAALRDRFRALGIALKSFFLVPTELIREHVVIRRVIDDRSWAILRGGLIATPILLVFGALFASADERFGNLFLVFQKLPSDFDLMAFSPYVAWTALAGWIFLTQAFSEVPEVPGAPTQKKTIQKTSIEVLIVFIAIDLLFALFLGQQLTLDSEANFSEHAREGFFQLLTVVILVGVMISGSALYMGGSPKKGLRKAQLTLIVLTVLVAGSALWRMQQYTQAYGLTELRLHSTGLMFTLIACLIVGANYVLGKSTSAKLHRQILTLFFTSMVAMNLANPHSLIVVSNTSNTTSLIDWSYLGTLSSDAAPALAEQPAGCEEVLGLSLGAHDELTSWGLFSWNLSRHRAASVDIECD